MPFDAGLLTQIYEVFASAAERWVPTIQQYALHVFAIFTGLELTWVIILSLLRGDDLHRLLTGVIRLLIYFGFLYALILNGPAWFPKILQTFQDVAGAVSSTNYSSFSPSAFLSLGITGAAAILSNWNTLGLLINPINTLLVAFGALFVVFTYAAIAAAYLLTLVEAVVAMGVGPFFIAFGPLFWTHHIAEGFLHYLLRLGVRVFGQFLIAGLTLNVLEQWVNQLQTAPAISPLNFFAFLGSGIVLAIVVVTLPRTLASSLVPHIARFELHPAVLHEG